MAKGFGKPEGTGILPCLPISDMSTGALIAVTIMSMLRDRERFGGSWHGNASLTAYNAATLEPWVGLYQPEIVQKIQERWGFGTWGPDIHVIELYYLMLEWWKKAGGLTNNEDFFVHFNDTVYGKDLKILRPVVQYDDPKSTPHWKSPPVPFCQKSAAEARWHSS
jgi:hypothetical protein